MAIFSLDVIQRKIFLVKSRIFLLTFLTVYNNKFPGQSEKSRERMGKDFSGISREFPGPNPNSDQGWQRYLVYKIVMNDLTLPIRKSLDSSRK